MSTASTLLRARVRALYLERAFESNTVTCVNLRKWESVNLSARRGVTLSNAGVWLLNPLKAKNPLTYPTLTCASNRVIVERINLWKSKVLFTNKIIEASRLSRNISLTTRKLDFTVESNAPACYPFKSLEILGASFVREVKIETTKRRVNISNVLNLWNLGISLS